MAQAIRHGKSVKPILIPSLANVAQGDVDRCQDFSGGVSQPSEKKYELGREIKVCVDKGTLESTASIKQSEYGTMDMYLLLAGLNAEPVNGLTLSDFSSSKVDIQNPGKDDYNGTTEQTLWLQKMVLNSFNVDINANSIIERSFELSSDFYKDLLEGNACLIFKTDDVGSGVAGNHDIVVNDPAPVEDPNNSGEFILQLIRVRAGVGTEIKLTTDYTYNNGTNTITILAALSDDHYRIWYSAVGYGTAGEPFTENDIDDCFLKADSVTIILSDGVHADVELDKVTALSIAPTFDRMDEGVVGSKEKIIKETKSTDVSLSFSAFVKGSTIEEVLMQQAGQSWGIIDPDKFDSIIVTVKIYSDSTKSTFRIGYKMTTVDFSDVMKDFSANEFASKSINLSTDNCMITASETKL